MSAGLVQKSSLQRVLPGILQLRAGAGASGEGKGAEVAEVRQRLREGFEPLRRGLKEL